MRYNAFLSYSHQADADLASALQTALQKLAKPWNHRRALHVFRDQTDLNANPGLWPSILEVLDDCEFLILLACPEAARSKWVQQEVEHWISRHGPERLLLVLTGGDLIWNAGTGEFDCTATTALARGLTQHFKHEPLWVDLRWARKLTGLSLQNERFQDAVAALAAPMHRKSKRDLVGEELRQHRRALSLARGAIVLLTTLVFGVLITAYVAIRQRNEAARQRDAANVARLGEAKQRYEAERQRNVAEQKQREAETQTRIAEAQRRRADHERTIALSRQLAAQSQLNRSPRPDALQRSVLLATESVRLSPTLENLQALEAALSIFPRRLIVLRAEHGAIEEGMFAASFSHDLRLIAAGPKNGLTLFDSRTGQQKWHRPATYLTGIAFSADGKAIAAGDGSKVMVLDSTTGVPKHEFPCGGLVYGLTFSPDGRFLAAGGFEKLLRMYDLASFTMLWERKLETYITAVAFSPDGRLVAAGTKVFYADTGEEAIQLKDDAVAERVCGAVNFSKDGKWLALGCSDRVVRVYDLQYGTSSIRLPLSSAATAVAFSGSTEYLTIAAGDGSLQVFWLFDRYDNGYSTIGRSVGHWTEQGVIHALGFLGDTREFLAANHTGSVVAFEAPAVGKSLALSADGRYVVASLTTLIETTTGRRIPWHLSPGMTSERPRTLALSRDASRVAVTGYSGKVRLFDSARAVERIFLGDIAALSGNGKRVAVARYLRAGIQVFDAENGQLLVELAPEARVLSLSATGRYLAAVEKGGLLVVEIKPSPTVQHFKQTAVISSLAFSPDDRYIAATGKKGNIYIFERKTGHLAAVIVQSTVSAMAFENESKYLATGGSESALRVFECATGREVWRVGQEGRIAAVAFTLDGKEIVTVAEDGVIRRIQRDSVQNACGRVSRNLTMDEWQHYIGPNAPYRRTCPTVGTSSDIRN
jgi:WD40 repeat protein